MILYFDSYITDVPLIKRSAKQLKESIRRKSSMYQMPKKIDIAKYTLASYAHIPWSYVLIRYELKNSSQNKEFDQYIRSLFPDAHIMHSRSATQKEYRKSIKILEKLSDKWIFYAPNNDHPIVSPDPMISTYIDRLVQKAEILKKKNRYVSIMYSHYSEFLNIPKKGTPEHFVNGRETEILEDDEWARVYRAFNGDFSSVQIVHLDHFKHWFDSSELGNTRVIRAEDVRHGIKTQDHVIIAPKKELCAHFDGYEHMIGQPNEIFIDAVPPLFIPKGFFTNAISVSYGYDKCRAGWVNINPCAENYSFRDSETGTDLKMTVDEIPFFWKKRIKKVDINSHTDQLKLVACAIKVQHIKSNPWDLKYQNLQVKTILFWVDYYMFSSRVQFRTVMSKIIKRFYDLV